MGNCICAIGWVDPQTSREVRGVLEETRGAIRDARTTVREQKPNLEAAGCATVGAVQQAASDMANKAGPVAEDAKAAVREVSASLQSGPSTPPEAEPVSRAMLQSDTPSSHEMSSGNSGVNVYSSSSSGSKRGR